MAEQKRTPCGGCQAWGHAPRMIRGRCSACDRDAAAIVAAHGTVEPTEAMVKAALDDKARVRAAMLREHHAREVFAFAVGIVGHEGTTTINHRSANRARAELLRNIGDVWPDLTYTQLFARKLGPPVTSGGFRRTALYRGLPDLKCGDRVAVRTKGNGSCWVDALGVVVGHNESANFDVLFDDDSPAFARLTLNVHPTELRVLTTTGEPA